MARKKQEEEKDEFIVLFTALSMILLAFFIMLNTMAVIDPSRSRKALNSLVGTFGIMPGFHAGPMGAFEEESIPKDPSRRIRSLTNMLRDIQSKDHPGLKIKERTDGRPVIELDTHTFFESGGRRLAPMHFSSLDVIGQIVRRSGYLVTIEGHTDGKPMRGSTSNWYLSAARAASVQRYMERTSMLKPGHLKSVGFGSSRPAKGAKNAQDPRNRRVELVFEITKDLKLAKKRAKTDSAPRTKQKEQNPEVQPKGVKQGKKGAPSKTAPLKKASTTPKPSEKVAEKSDVTKATETKTSPNKAQP